MSNQHVAHGLPRDEALSLVAMAEEKVERVYALLSGIRALIPKDDEGEAGDSCLFKLVDIAMDEIADTEHLMRAKRLLIEGQSLANEVRQ